MPTLERRSHVMRWWMAAALALCVFVVPRPVEAQFGSRLRGDRDEGKVYGLDVRDTPSVVFVVDFAIHEGEGFVDQAEDIATGDASKETQMDVAQKTGESVALAVVPGGRLVGGALDKHRDRAGRAENNVRSAIKGLEDDQDFGIVYFDSLGSRNWRDALVEAGDENRGAGEDLIDELYSGKGLATTATMGLSDKLTDDPSETHDPPTAEILLSGIQRAFALNPETIVVIVAVSPPNARRLIDGVARLNAGRKVVIHTAGFTEEKDAPSALRDLARANGGVYLSDDTDDDED